MSNVKKCQKCQKSESKSVENVKSVKTIKKTKKNDKKIKHVKHVKEMSKMSTHSKCQKYQNVKYIKSQIPQKPLHVTLFPSSLPSPRHRYMWHLSPGPSQTTETVSPRPSQTTETVTCDTFSLVLPKPQKPLHVTPFPLSRPNPRNRYMWHLFPDPSKAPETVTCHTFSFVPPQAHDNLCVVHLVTCDTLPVTLFFDPKKTRMR